MTLQFIYSVAQHPLLWWLLSVAIVIAGVLKTSIEDKTQGFDRWIILVILLVAATFGGDVFASLTHAVSAGYDYNFSMQSVISGVKGTIGAILGSSIAVTAYLYFRKIPVLIYADKIVPYAALAYAVARLGCFTNGDDFGVLSALPWSVTFGPFTEAWDAHLSRGWINAGDAHSLSVHPSQLYHVLAGLTGFILLRAWHTGWAGSRFALAWVYYGVTRFTIQFFRDDHWSAGMVIDPAQWFSLLFIATGVALWFLHKVNCSGEKRMITG